MIVADKLVKDFGAKRAVDDVSLTVKRGEVLGFLGPNGAGKSTTMKMLTGFLKPTSGRAEIAGHDVATDAMAARRQLGYLPEGAPLYPD
ncbi:MAG: ATP-binding cassette domain-containing protein, partial [Alphaproteobacteria bacterium]